MPEMAGYRSGSKAVLPWSRALLRRSVASILVIIGLQGCGNEEPTEPKAGIERVKSGSNLVTGIHDDFTDTDGTLLQNHTPDAGTVPFSWIPANSWGGEFLQAMIQSNGVTSIPGMDWAYLTSVQAGDEAEIQVEVLGTPPSGQWQEIAIYFRTQDADVSELNGYIGPLWSLGSDSSFVAIQRPNAQGGVVFQRAGPVAVGVHTLRAEINTSGELEVSLDGTFMGKGPLGSLPPPARIGLGTWGTPVARITSFSAGPAESPLACTSPVERGQQVSCAFTGSSNWSVTGWEFVAEGAAATSAGAQKLALAATADYSSLPPVQETSTSNQWSGIAAVGGLVKVHVTDGTTERTWETSFTVTSRRSQWKDNWDYKPGQTIADAEVTHLTPYVGINCPQQFPNPVECFVHSGEWVQPEVAMEPGYTATRITSGPNRGYWLALNIRYDMKRFGSVHPGVLPTSSRKHPVPQKMLSKACKQGLGVKNANTALANMNQVTQYCGLPASPGYDMTAYVAGIWGHEGYGINGGVGHQKLAEDAAGRPENDPYTAIEDLVFPDAAGLADAVKLLVVPIAEDIHLWAADPEESTVNGGPTGNWTPEPGHYMYFWEPQPNGTFAWAAYVLTHGS